MRQSYELILLNASITSFFFIGEAFLHVMVAQDWKPDLTVEEALLIPAITIAFALLSAVISHFIAYEVSNKLVRFAITFAVTFSLFCIEALIDYFLGNDWVFVFPSPSEIRDIFAITFAISLLSSTTIHFAREFIERKNPPFVFEGASERDVLKKTN